MEFEHIGSHCAHPDCRQKDFLPFNCDYCHRNYCLDHRTYDTHNCAGSKAKNIVSIACPICNKTVKYDETQDINIIWEEHYLHHCSNSNGNGDGKPKNSSIARATVDSATIASNPRCNKAGCNIKLGISNSFTCSKCHVTFCMTHRLPEEHLCNISNNNKNKRPESANQRLTMFNTSTLYGNKSNTSNKGQQQSSNKKMKTNPSSDKTSSSKKDSKQSMTTTAQYDCPICSKSFGSEREVGIHFDEAHNVGGQTTATKTNTDKPIPVINLTEEVCPHCGARFDDIVALVEHYERVHPQNTSPNTNNNNATNSGTNENCRIA